MYFYEDMITIETPNGPATILAIIGEKSGLMLTQRNFNALHGYTPALYPSGKAIANLGLMDAPTKEIARLWLEEIANLPISWIGTPEEVHQRIREHFGQENELRLTLINAYEHACRGAREAEDHSFLHPRTQA